MLGYTVRDPATGELGNLVSWTGLPPARQWQRETTVFERLVAAGTSVTSIGPARFAGSGLTEAALRGPTYKAAESLAARVDATVDALRRPGRGVPVLGRRRQGRPPPRVGVVAVGRRARRARRRARPARAPAAAGHRPGGDRRPRDGRRGPVAAVGRRDRRRARRRRRAGRGGAPRTAPAPRARSRPGARGGPVAGHARRRGRRRDPRRGDVPTGGSGTSPSTSCP